MRRHAVPRPSFIASRQAVAPAESPRETHADIDRDERLHAWCPKAHDGRRTPTASNATLRARYREQPRVTNETPITTHRSARAPRHWAPEWIAVLTLAVAIIALGGGLFASLHAMESRIRENMRSMEVRLSEDIREVRGHVGTLQVQVAHLDERATRLDERATRLDERVTRLEVRFTRLEVRFDEEFPPRTSVNP